MYRYKLIENIMILNNICKDVMELIFNFQYSHIPYNNLNIEFKKKLKNELGYKFIETIIIDKPSAKKIKKKIRCYKCDKLINVSSRFEYFNYENRIDHYRLCSGLKSNYNNTILFYLENNSIF
jgi:hypothetical protein